MNLLIIAALAAVCGAAKLDRTYLPPANARAAGGSPGALQAPNSFVQNSAPKGSYNNDFQGVVVDAALAGTRASDSESTGLGGPRNSYGSTASKVGDAAFRGSQAGFRFPQNFGSESQFTQDSENLSSDQFGEAREIPESEGFGGSRGSEGFEVEARPERPQAAQERTASTLRFDSEVGVESFNYAFETDNGISAEETGVATNGVQAQGGYSYTGDDGKVYTVTYTADEGGYQPRGDHLPTPPPIPEEILKSLEQNARDEANGVIDDGLYDAQKYNTAGDYAESDSVNGKQNGRPSVNTGNDVDASGTFINQNNVAFNPNNRQRGDDKTVNQFQANNGFKNSASNGSGRKEYLPPFQPNRQNQRQQIPTASADNSDTDSSSTFQQETSEGSGDFPPQSQQNQHASRPSTQSFGSRPSSPAQNQYSGFKQSQSSSQFNQNGNRFGSPQSNRQQFGDAPVNTASHSGHNQFSAHTSASLNSQHSTSIPDTELTTPFESSPEEEQPSAPSTNNIGFNAQANHNAQSQFGSHHQTSQAPAQPTIPSFPQSRPQSPNNRPFGGNRKTQPMFSTQAPRQQEQFAQQSAFGQQTFGTKRPQFSSQNQFSQTTDNQFASSTQKPQFPRQPTAQDDSYYYNQPSRAFNTPQTQGSRFPSAPSNQFDRVTQRPFASQTQTTQYPEEENYPSTAFPSQTSQRQGSSRYPRPPSYPTESTPSNNQFQANAIASATNGITQASASSFAAPTSAPGFNRQPSSQSKQQFQQSSFQSKRPAPEPIKPSFSAQATAQSQTTRGQSQFEKQNFESAQPLSQQPLQDVKQPKLDDDTKPDAPVTNQQYNGEIYEYTKPAEMLPPPENGFGQFGTKMPSTPKPAQSRPQFGQSAAPSQSETSDSFAPQPSQFSQSTKAPQSNQFGSRPQYSQTTSLSQQASSSFSSKPQFSQNGAQGDQFSAQTQEQTTDEFDAKPARQQFNQAEQHSQFNQRKPFSQSQNFATAAQSQGNFAAEVPKPFGQNGRPCCKPTQFGQQNFGGRPSQFGGESFGSTFQSSALKPDQSQSVAGKGEVFGGPRAPPSFDDTGYHY